MMPPIPPSSPQLCTLLLASLCLSPPTKAQSETEALAPARAEPSRAAPIRVGLRARRGGASKLTSLRYIGGFETKSLLLETLVRRGPDGRIRPALAAEWQVEDGGRTFRIRLREDARFHDGSKVTAQEVCTHFRRWMNLPEHNWLRVNQRIRAARPVDDHSFTIHLDRPYALLADLLAINPCAIVGPQAKDWEGEFVRPMGTGPFRFAAAFDQGRRWRLQAVEPGGPHLDVTFYPRGRDLSPVYDLIQGRIDAFVGGWDEDLPAEWLSSLAQDPRFRLHSAPGSSVVYLSFKMDAGPTASAALRRRVAAAIDRRELIRIVEGGRADPAYSWAAPCVAFWPQGPVAAAARSVPRTPASEPASGPAPRATPIRLRVTAGRGAGRGTRVALEVVAQLRRAGFQAEFVAGPLRLPEASLRVVDAHSAVRPLTTESGEVRVAGATARRQRIRGAEIRVQITHGMPYCPHQSLVARFGKPRRPGSPRPAVLAELEKLVELAAHTPLEQDRLQTYARIQSLIDRETIIVPLYAPQRVALTTAAVEGLRLEPDVYHVDLSSLRRKGEGR